MDSYWDLYVAYVHHCVEYNKKHDIDPHHYEMEWNHFLPQCIFGDQPIGQYLLLRQHAIASALQTLAFKKNCMCGWHKKYLPGILIETAWPFFGAWKKQERKDKVALHQQERVGFFNPEFQEKIQDKLKNEKIGVHDPQYWENRKIKNLPPYNIDFHKKGGLANGGKGMKTLLAQVWESTIDGYQGNVGVVARHNKANGWDPGARVRVQ